MPTYEYECEACALRFERREGIQDAPTERCPECGGPVHRRISGGAGFVVKGSDRGPRGAECSLTRSGRTCCGRQERCDRPPCGT